MAALDPKKDEKTRKDMSERFPIGSEIEVDGKSGKVVGHALHSKTLIVLVGGDRHKVPMPKGKKA
jgi:hypothetical protein